MSLRCALVLALVAGIAAGPARAASKSGTLTPAERRAITIDSISAAGDSSIGVVVTVTFQGDVERYLGQGNLRRALLALVLVPSSPAKTPTGVLDEGGGFQPVLFPVPSGRGRHATAKIGAVDFFAPERVLHMTPARYVGVIREGNEVSFHVAGLGLSDIKAIKLKVFATSPTGSGSLTRGGWRKLLHDRPSAVAAVNVDFNVLSSRQLTILRTQLSALVSIGLAPELRDEEQVAMSLKASIAGYPRLAHLISRIPALKSVRGSDLVRESANTRARIGGLKVGIRNANGLLAQVEALIAACAHPTPAAVTQLAAGDSTVEVVQTQFSLCQHLTAQPSLTLSRIAPAHVPVIDVDDRVRSQQFAGLGAALTDSSAWLIYDQLPAGVRGSLLQDLFGSAGLHLNFIRVPIGASDFTVSAQPYSYDDLPPGQSDPSLSQFSIGHDLSYIVPALRAALAINPGLEILANPWSPPGWMKSNDSLDNAGGQGTLLASGHGPLAAYFVKFIQAYEAAGVPIAAITPQNEPGVEAEYPGMALPEPEEAQFISQNLQPALAAAGLHPKIYGSDLSWDQLAYADSLASGATAGDLSGIAWHCYFGSATAMSQLHQAAAGLDQIVDECSPEIKAFGMPEFLISSLRNWASVVSVWNVALDPRGGPEQSANGCPGCKGLVTIDEGSHTVSFSTAFFQLGQLSAFVHPGASRIDSRSFVSYGVNSANIETVSASLDDVAFVNPDGSKVLVAYNNSPAPISFGVGADGRYFSYTIPAQATTTFTWR